MRFVTFRREDAPPEAGVIVRDTVVPLTSAGFPDMLAVLRGGAPARAKIENWIYNPPPGAAFSLDSVTLLAPIPRPPKLICVGLNYRDHALESKMEIPTVPTIFATFATAVIGPGQPLVLPNKLTPPEYDAQSRSCIA